MTPALVRAFHLPGWGRGEIPTECSNTEHLARWRRGRSGVSRKFSSFVNEYQGFLTFVRRTAQNCGRSLRMKSGNVVHRSFASSETDVLPRTPTARASLSLR